MRSCRSVWVTLLFILIFSLLSLSQNQPSPDDRESQNSGDRAEAARGPSTAEERAKALKYAKDLEDNPLGPNAREERGWMLEWIDKVPDITVPICSTLLPASLSQTQRRFAHEITYQMVISSAAYIIEHPKNTDEDAPYIAGVEGALRTYENIVKVRPQARWSV
ncbi:MAG: hypothetical protein JOY79_11875, partial [Acidobacteriaceae bacterium]|nr:hypothetical protein [Acidobacteriaceae bacterium]